MLLPTQWKRAELLRWLTDLIQKNGLIFEEQTLEEKTPQALNQVLNIRLKLNGEFELLLQFLNQLKADRDYWCWKNFSLKKLHLPCWNQNWVLKWFYLPTEDWKSLQQKKVHEVPNVVFDINLAFSAYSIRSACCKNKPVGENACSYSQKSFSQFAAGK